MEVFFIWNPFHMEVLIIKSLHSLERSMEVDGMAPFPCEFHTRFEDAGPAGGAGMPGCVLPPHC